MKVDLEVVEKILKDNNVSSAVAEAIAAAAQEARVPRTPRPRKPFLLLVSDPNGVIPEGTELVGWALQVEEDLNIVDLTKSLVSAGAVFNATKTAKKDAVLTVGDLMEAAPAKLLAEYGITRKHKEPVFMVVTDNKIPVSSADE